MPLLAKPFCQSASKSKLQGKLRKRPCIKNKAKYSGSIETTTLNESGIRTENLHNHLVQRSKILGKNSLERLVRLAYEFAKSVTKISSKICEFKTYDKTVNNLVYRNRWQKAIDEELQNLDSHQTQSYTTLLSG